MKNVFSLVAALVVAVLIGREAGAQLFRRPVQVNVNTPGASVQVRQPGFFGRRVVNVQTGGGVAYTNSQLLIDRRFRAAQIAKVNSFTYNPVNSSANIRFRHDRVVLLRHQPIVAVPIIEQYKTVTPVTVIRQVTSDTGCSTCTGGATTAAPAAGDANYLTTPPATVTQPQVHGYTVPQAVTGYTGSNRIFFATTPGCHSQAVQRVVYYNQVRRFVVPQRIFVRQPVFVRNRVFVPRNFQRRVEQVRAKGSNRASGIERRSQQHGQGRTTHRGRAG